MEQALTDWLAQSGADYQMVEHVAVHTIPEALAAMPALPGLMTKNVFLRDGKGARHLLVIVPHDKRIDLAALGALLPATRLGMASPERLLKHLGVTPGAVSLFALINDTAGAVELVLDTAVWKADYVHAHPLRNTATVSMTHAALEGFLKRSGHEARVLEVPAAVG